MNDISPVAVAASTTRIPGIVFPVIEKSLLVILCGMTWAVPLSSALASNLFRVSVVLWIVLAFRPARTWPSSPIFLPMLCFFAITALASLFSFDPVASWQQMKTIELAFAAVMIGDAMRCTRVLHWLLGGLLATSFLVSVLAGWQYWHRAQEFDRAQGLYKHYVN